MCIRDRSATGPIDDAYLLEGTMAGRAFSSGEIVTTDTTWWVPLVDGTERLGVLELEFDDAPHEQPQVLADLSALLVLLVISMRRYTDVWLRTRRALTMTPPAQAPWHLRPPPAHTGSDVAGSGLPPPASGTGGRAGASPSPIHPPRPPTPPLDAPRSTPPRRGERSG